MGRKRIARGKAREPITISLPRDLVIQFDNTLGEHTRSRRLESIIVNYLRTAQHKLIDFNRHAYECHDCGRAWHQNRYSEPEYFFCAGNDGCGSSKISYLGIWEEEE